MLFAADRQVSKMTVFLEASLALMLTSGIGVLAGGMISQYVSERHLHYIAGIGFIGIGIWTILKIYGVTLLRGPEAAIFGEEEASGFQWMMSRQ